MQELPPQLVEVLSEAQELGFLGRAPLEDHVCNGLAFATVIAERPRERCIDLGSGGGVPALVVALAVPDLQLVCVDRGARRCAFLDDAAAVLGLDDRMTVLEGDAEALAREAHLVGSAGWVTARSFGPPAVTAEAACRYLAVGGELVVSEPPDALAGERWRAPALAALGFEFSGVSVVTGEPWSGGLSLAQDTPPAGADAKGPAPSAPSPTSLARCVRVATTIDERYPRRAATVRKRPLF